MLTLDGLSPQPGSKKNRKRIGRGPGSGHGKTATRGHKGYKARTGSGIKIGFEGGQMPLQRRLPKRGFNNIFKKQCGVVNLKDLVDFEAGERIDRTSLLAKGLISKRDELIKVLATGEIDKALTFSVDKISEAARQKIQAAGGTIEE